MKRTNSDLQEENAIFRRMLAVAHAGIHLYADDGELQDSSKKPYIDWKRDSAETILRKVRQRNAEALKKWQEEREKSK